MVLDRFLDTYISLVSRQVETCRAVLETKNFVSLDEFAKAQGRLQGLREAIELLRSVPEDD